MYNVAACLYLTLPCNSTACLLSCRLETENRTLDSARKAETDARTADKAGFLDKLARLSSQVESLKVIILPWMLINRLARSHTTHMH